MSNDEKDLEELAKEQDALKHSIALNKILNNLLKSSKKEILRLWISLLVLAITFVVTLLYIHKTNVDVQYKYLEFLKSFDYEIGEEITETITQESGDSGINNYNSGNTINYN